MSTFCFFLSLVAGHRRHIREVRPLVAPWSGLPRFWSPDTPRLDGPGGWRTQIEGFAPDGGGPTSFLQHRDGSGSGEDSGHTQVSLHTERRHGSAAPGSFGERSDDSAKQDTNAQNSDVTGESEDEESDAESNTESTVQKVVNKVQGDEDWEQEDIALINAQENRIRKSEKMLEQGPPRARGFHPRPPSAALREAMRMSQFAFEHAEEISARAHAKTEALYHWRTGAHHPEDLQAQPASLLQNVYDDDGKPDYDGLAKARSDLKQLAEDARKEAAKERHTREAHQDADSFIQVEPPTSAENDAAAEAQDADRDVAAADVPLELGSDESALRGAVAELGEDHASSQRHERLRVDMKLRADDDQRTLERILDGLNASAEDAAAPASAAATAGPGSLAEVSHRRSNPAEFLAKLNDFSRKGHRSYEHMEAALESSFGTDAKAVAATARVEAEAARRAAAHPLSSAVHMRFGAV